MGRQRQTRAPPAQDIAKKITTSLGGLEDDLCGMIGSQVSRASFATTNGWSSETTQRMTLTVCKSQSALTEPKPRTNRGSTITVLTDGWMDPIDDVGMEVIDEEPIPEEEHQVQQNVSPYVSRCATRRPNGTVNTVNGCSPYVSADS